MEESGWEQCITDAEEGSIPFDILTAASLGDVEVVQFYVNRDPALSLSSHNAEGKAGWSAILLSAWYGHAETTAVLASAARRFGVEPGAVSAPNCGRTTLMVAAFHGYEDVVKILAEGSAPKARDAQGRTALHHAVNSGNDRIVRILLNAGVDPGARDIQGYTAKTLAEVQGRTCIVEMLSLAAFSLSSHPRDHGEAEGGEALYCLLENLELGKYWSVFLAHRVQLQQFLQMGEDDLRNIGITLLGPRRKMFLEIQRRKSVRRGLRFESMGSRRV